MKIGKKRSRQSLFDDDGDGKGDHQTSLHSFFSPKRRETNDGDARVDRTTAVAKMKATNTGSTKTTDERKKKSTTMEQMYLDLGQRKNYGTAECQLCGMVFTWGLAEDTAMHAKVCNDYRSGVAFSNRITCCRSTEVGPRGVARIVEVRSTDSSSVVRQKVQAACAIAYAELGFGGRNADDDGSTKRAEYGTNKERNVPSAARTAYLYVHDQRIVGLCVVERITEAHRLTADADDDDTAANRSRQDSQAVLGIHLLWIHPNHRRKGIAQSLIDLACATMVYGYHIPPAQVAFSSPTMAGTRFAQWYCDRLDILVYDCV